MRQLEARHLRDLRFPEVVRALRALSSAYVERRDTAIAGGRVLDSAGKRAAFALYYGPLHFVAVRHVLEALEVPPRADGTVLDLGCGTGVVGAALALGIGVRRVRGIDTHPWTLDEARFTYAALGLDGSVMRGRIERLRPAEPDAVIAAGYVVNELGEADRQAAKAWMRRALERGAGLLVVEPISGRAAPWWDEWVDALHPYGVRADTWSLTLDPPELARRLGEAAGLTPTAARLRTLSSLAR